MTHKNGMYRTAVYGGGIHNGVRGGWNPCLQAVFEYVVAYAFTGVFAPVYAA